MSDGLQQIGLLRGQLLRCPRRNSAEAREAAVGSWSCGGVAAAMGP